MKIVVASRNPKKIEAVENVMRRIYENVEILSVEVDSGVTYTPVGDEETIKGARNRAERALQMTDAELGIGIEGGISQLGSAYYLATWVAIVDRNLDVSLGHGGGIEVPEKIVQEVKKGKELGNVVDDYFGKHNVKQKMGLSGILTNNLVDRQKITEEVITYAMARKLHPELYGR